jgi:hypothetical protein
MRVNSLLRLQVRLGRAGVCHTRARVRREISQFYHKMLWKGVFDDGENGHGRWTY